MSSPAPNYAPPPPPPQTLHSPPLTVVLTVVLLIFFLLGFFSIYFCRCFMEALFNTWHLRRTPSGDLVGSGNNADVLPAHTGLDPMLIKSFPTLVYSSIKEVRKEKYGLECAICLIEFEDDSLLRLLTACYHVFHQECVDLWLESHKTCPVCRRDLDSPHVFADKSSETPPGTNNNNGTGNVFHVNAVAIDINDDDGQPLTFGSSTMNCGNGGEAAPKRGIGGSSSANNDIAERFPRSHSTGHSIARARTEEENRDQDRHRLRLPEHMKMRLLRGHHWTGSCETYGEFHRHRSCNSPNAVGRRLGEVSGSSDH